MVTTVQRFDVFLVGLDPTQGAEMSKTRPAVVVSPDDMNQHIRTVIVAPMTSTIRAYPSRVAVRFQEKAGQVALDQIRAVDKSRLVRRLGRLSPERGAAIAAVLVEMFVLT